MEVRRDLDSNPGSSGCKLSAVTIELSFAYLMIYNHSLTRPFLYILEILDL